MVPGPARQAFCVTLIWTTSVWYTTTEAGSHVAEGKAANTPADWPPISWATIRRTLARQSSPVVAPGGSKREIGP